MPDGISPSNTNAIIHCAAIRVFVRTPLRHPFGLWPVRCGVVQLYTAAWVSTRLGRIVVPAGPADDALGFCSGH